jgi:hypothetical protein
LTDGETPSSWPNARIFRELTLFLESDCPATDMRFNGQRCECADPLMVSFDGIQCNCLDALARKLDGK